MGEFFSVLIRHEVGEIERLPNPKKFASYTGVIPSTYSSGKRITHGWTCFGSVDCWRVRTEYAEKESSATNEPNLPAGISPGGDPAGRSFTPRSPPIPRK